MDSKYRSRKFIVTLLTMAITVYLASIGKMDANTAMVLSAAIASYNVMQGMSDKNGTS